MSTNPFHKKTTKRSVFLTTDQDQALLLLMGGVVILALFVLA